MYEQDIRLGPGTGTFTQHTFEILIMLLGAFLLGIWLGWILWNRYKQEAERLRLDNQSLKVTSEAFMTELSELKLKYNALEADNSNMSTQALSLNRNNANMRDRISQLEVELLETQSRNRQVETELSLSQNPDIQVVDDIPLEVVDPAQSMAAQEPDLVAPDVAVNPPAPDVSLIISKGDDTLAEVTIQSPAQVEVNIQVPEQVEVNVQDPEEVSTSALHMIESLRMPETSIMPVTESESILIGAAAGNIQDDLTVVEGIGPKIQMLLHQYGVRTYQQLADTPVERLREILNTAGPQLAMHDPGTWPSQANLAANDQWDALKSIQGFLKGGKKPT